MRERGSYMDFVEEQVERFRNGKTIAVPKMHEAITVNYLKELLEIDTVYVEEREGHDGIESHLNIKGYSYHSIQPFQINIMRKNAIKNKINKLKKQRDEFNKDIDEQIQGLVKDRVINIPTFQEAKEEICSICRYVESRPKNCRNEVCESQYSKFLNKFMVQ